MGTTYNINVEGNDKDKLQSEIDQLLLRVNAATSTYEKNSLISLFNKNYKTYISLVSKDTILTNYFNENFRLSQQIYNQTYGAFDPTVMPLVNYWGFGYSGRDHIEHVDTSEVIHLLSLTGLNKLELDGQIIKKANQAMELDFSGIAKGFGVDQVADLFDGKGIINYYIEIGGEVFAKGLNSKGITWRTGVSIPSPNSNINDYQQVIEISNKGIATSGNYRNYYETDGKIYSHTINPKTGFPERNDVLSATIIAESCALADGYATACMVLGLENAMKLIKTTPEIEGILIYQNEKGEFVSFDSTNK